LYSPKKFTQHQLFALLVLKTHQKLDYRGVVALLEDMQELVRELPCVPHYTTLQKASARLMGDEVVQQLRRLCLPLLGTTVQRFRKNNTRPVELAAMDSTGLETSRASRYFVKRRNNTTKLEQTVTYSTFPKLE
jgi:hypothetical protein